MGIIVNDGVRLPTVRVERLRFAESTPYETVVKAAPDDGRRVIRPEIARVVRQALVNVVENGPARRATGALLRSEEQTSELQSLKRRSSSLFCLTTKHPKL